MSFMFKHWFEDDPDYVDEDPPKMRENELHKPKVYIKATNDYMIGGANCVICGKLLVQTTKYGEVDEEDVKLFVREYTPNYCPKCGARLKEIR